MSSKLYSGPGTFCDAWAFKFSPRLVENDVTTLRSVRWMRMERVSLAQHKGWKKGETASLALYNGKNTCLVVGLKIQYVEFSSSLQYGYTPCLTLLYDTR